MALALAFVLAFVLAALPVAQAQESHAVDAESEVEGVTLLSAPPAATGDNRWQWLADAAEARNIGLRITTGKAPITVDRYVVRIAEIGEAVGRGARGARFRFRIVQFSDNRQKRPLEPPIVVAEGHLPPELNPGESLVIDFPETLLEASHTYGLELEFIEPAEERSINIATTARENFPSGLIYFIHGSSAQEYVFKAGSFCFQLMKR